MVDARFVPSRGNPQTIDPVFSRQLSLWTISAHWELRTIGQTAKLRLLVPIFAENDEMADVDGRVSTAVIRFRVGRQYSAVDLSHCPGSPVESTHIGRSSSSRGSGLASSRGTRAGEQGSGQRWAANQIEFADEDRQLVDHRAVIDVVVCVPVEHGPPADRSTTPTRRPSSDRAAS
jgi:hypothetical protein